MFFAIPYVFHNVAMQLDGQGLKFDTFHVREMNQTKKK